MSGPQAPEKGAATNNKAVLNQLQHVQAQLKNLQSGTRLVHRAMGVPPPHSPTPYTLFIASGGKGSGKNQGGKSSGGKSHGKRSYDGHYHSQKKQKW